MSISTHQIVTEPLESVDFVSTLSSFSDLLQSSLGPRGGLKMIVTGGGYLILTSSSSRIINNIILDHPLCLFISQIMKSQLADYKDGGLYTGILTSSVLFRTLSQNTVPVPSASTIIQQISSFIVERFNSVKILIDFSTIKHLMPLVKSILRSKPACSLTKTEEHRLSVNIVKAFLGSVNDCLGDVIVLSEEDTYCDSTECLYPGVLYQRSFYETADQKLFEGITNRHMLDKHLPIIIFNIMLSDEKPKKRRDEAYVEVENVKCFDLAKALRVFEFANQLGVVVVACQKVVHADLSLYLRRNGILLLDRMGTELTGHLIKLSGSKPVADINRCTDKEFLVPYLGSVSAVRQVLRGKRSYVALEREDRNVTTLVIGGINSESSAELKVTTQQGLYALRHLMSDPYVVPGAGCLEMNLVAGLERKVQRAYDEGSFAYPLSHIRACLRLLQLSLLSAGGINKANLSSRMTDTAYYHAWQHDELNDWSTCCCGLVTSAMVHAQGRDWRYLDLNADTLFAGCEISRSTTVLTLNENSVLDLFACKFNAVKLAMESYSGLINIGMIVYKPTQ